jgi:hypothetical protein
VFRSSFPEEEPRASAQCRDTITDLSHKHRATAMSGSRRAMLRWHQGFLVAVLTPRLRGGPSRGEMALRGKPGDKGRCGFLGGTRSPRPHGKAGRRPRHNIIIGGKRRAGGRTGPCLSEARVIRTGVQSPPLRGVGYPS